MFYQSSMCCFLMLPQSEELYYTILYFCKKVLDNKFRCLYFFVFFVAASEIKALKTLIVCDEYEVSVSVVSVQAG